MPQRNAPKQMIRYLYEVFHFSVIPFWRRVHNNCIKNYLSSWWWEKVSASDTHPGVLHTAILLISSMPQDL